MTVLKRVEANENINMILSCDDRISSFNNWSFSSENDNLNPKKMAEFGFFHTPTEEEPDSVTCSVCLNSLSNWEQYEDPEIIHCRLCPDCPLSTLKKSFDQWTVKDVMDFGYYQSLSKLVYSLILRPRNIYTINQSPEKNRLKNKYGAEYKK
ncbi:hypothetical protein HZS_495 [Henneguya salminicola]|nr:hypothetical protein HZS_495 [Henneguya salminicola]